MIDDSKKPKYAPKLNSSLQQASIKQTLINDENDNGLDNQQFAFAIDLPQENSTQNNNAQNNVDGFKFTSGNQALASAQPNQQPQRLQPINPDQINPNQRNNAQKLPFADPNYNPQFANNNMANANQNNRPANNRFNGNLAGTSPTNSPTKSHDKTKPDKAKPTDKAKPNGTTKQYYINE